MPKCHLCGKNVEEITSLGCCEECSEEMTDGNVDSRGEK